MQPAKLTVTNFSLIWGVLIFVRLLGFSGLPETITEWILVIDASPMLIIICILPTYAIHGMFMDAIGMLLFTLPVVYPAVIALGFDSICVGILGMTGISPKTVTWRWNGQYSIVCFLRFFASFDCLARFYSLIVKYLDQMSHTVTLSDLPTSSELDYPILQQLEYNFLQN